MINKLTSHPAFPDAKKAFAAYRAARDELLRLGIIRSERSVAGDYGEWLAAQMLDLELSPNGVQAGFDAIDSNGKTYQIKTRTVDDLGTSTSFDMKDPGHPFDYLLGVFLSQSCDVLAVVRISASEVERRAARNRSSRRLRWTADCWISDWAEVLYRDPSA